MIKCVYNGKATNYKQEPYADNYIIETNETFGKFLEYVETLINDMGMYGSLRVTYLDSNGREWGEHDVCHFSHYETKNNFKNEYSDFIKNCKIVKGHEYIYDADKARVGFDIDILRSDLDD